MMPFPPFPNPWASIPPSPLGALDPTSPAARRATPHPTDATLLDNHPGAAQLRALRSMNSAQFQDHWQSIAIGLGSGAGNPAPLSQFHAETIARSSPAFQAYLDAQPAPPSESPGNPHIGGVTSNHALSAQQAWLRSQAATLPQPPDFAAAARTPAPLSPTHAMALEALRLQAPPEVLRGALQLARRRGLVPGASQAPFRALWPSDPRGSGPRTGRTLETSASTMRVSSETPDAILAPDRIDNLQPTVLPQRQQATIRDRETGQPKVVEVTRPLSRANTPAPDPSAPPIPLSIGGTPQFSAVRSFLSRALPSTFSPTEAAQIHQEYRPAGHNPRIAPIARLTAALPSPDNHQLLSSLSSDKLTSLIDALDTDYIPPTTAPDPRQPQRAPIIGEPPSRRDLAIWNAQGLTTYLQRRDPQTLEPYDTPIPKLTLESRDDIRMSRGPRFSAPFTTRSGKTTQLPLGDMPITAGRSTTLLPAKGFDFRGSTDLARQLRTTTPAPAGHIVTLSGRADAAYIHAPQPLTMPFDNSMVLDSEFPAAQAWTQTGRGLNLDSPLPAPDATALLSRWSTPGAKSALTATADSPLLKRAILTALGSPSHTDALRIGEARTRYLEARGALATGTLPISLPSRLLIEVLNAVGNSRSQALPNLGPRNLQAIGYTHGIGVEHYPLFPNSQRYPRTANTGSARRYVRYFGTPSPPTK